MKKWNIILILVGIPFLGLGIYLSINYWQFLHEEQVTGSILIRTSLYFLAMAAMLLIFLLLVFIKGNRHAKVIKHLAYYNIKYDAFNENKFIQDMRHMYRKVKRKKNQSSLHGMVVSLGIEESSQQLWMTLKEGSEEAILEILSHALKDFFGLDPHCFYAYNDLGSFLLFYEGEDMRAIQDHLYAFHDALQTKVIENGYNAHVHLSFGGCIYDPKLDIKAMIQRANVARDSIGSSHVTSFVVYGEELIDRSYDNITLTNEINDALEREEFEVYYQPKFDIQHQRFVGAEALIRWNHPTKGLVGPGSFIPFAEKNNQIIEIDRYVFEHVCRDVVSWKKRGIRLLTISVNLSRSCLYQSDLIDFMKTTMEKHRVSPMLLEIELTESAASTDMLFVLSVIKQIKALRLRVAIDDFGTGYSSLSNLRRLPIDTLKMDKSFFDDLEIDKKTRDIVQITSMLAKSLEMTTVCEGIETKKQVDILRKMGCDSIQGNFFAKAMPISQYEALLKHNRFEHKGGEES